MTRRPERQATPHSRFEPYKGAGGEIHELVPDHPAVVEGRTLFPTRVSNPLHSPNILVSGHSNPKTGRRVLKGPWAGKAIFTVTLQERATCPRSCVMWRGCYGNNMQWPRRHDASHPDFIATLESEVIYKALENPKGFVVRLHVLGDFYSVEYVHVWRHLMETLPGLHVFGYTARRVDAGDEDSAAIAREVEGLNIDFPTRWVVRTSHADPGRMHSIVVKEDPRRPDVIVCPAQVEATAACSTCGLCWAPGARDKTIAFLAHGKPKGARS